MQVLIALSLIIGPGVVNSLAVPRVITARQTLDSYDYVVVGAGTAGGTVAARLAEDPNVSVLVIEAGPLDNNEEFITIPRQAGAARGTRYDWNFTSVAQTSASGRAIAVPAGRVVGGATVLNGMAYDRGAASDYDAWVELGNEGWGWDSLLPYFKKTERFVPPPQEFANRYNITWDLNVHGTEGPIYAAYPTVMSNLNQPWIDGLNSLGIPKERDGHNGRALNVFYSPNALDPRSMTRSYVKPGIFLPATERDNFHALLETTVSRLVTAADGGTVRVVEVEYAASASAPVRRVKVNRDAIVAAGAIGSPRLLQVSGIGPSAHLASVGVPVVVDLPGVGTNYQDHSFQSYSAFLSNPPPPDPPRPLTPEQEYRQNKTGPWTTSGPTLFAFLTFKSISTRYQEILNRYASQNPTTHLWAGIDATVLAGYRDQQAVLSRRLATDLMALTEYVWQGGGTMYSAQHPFSRGFVRIRTRSVFDAPTIDFRYGSNPIDYDVLAESVRFMRRVIQTPAIARFNPTESAPGPRAITDAQLREHNARGMTTMFHSCCTNPMQPKAKGGVVDSQLRVYGTTNLRVVDASVLPLIPGTHIQSTVYAVAERLADLLKADYHSVVD